ncbi:cinnamoyl-CoA reductase, putative [Ricinus communis]|uniref:Cinnamoyl-CoA reductase, putative n=2 Tax=Ricinus communis TaxID=3988 RepID=B9T5X0_RICCO|nr:cinnamoyl-CoA reductase, putative [Ricinus communis]
MMISKPLIQPAFKAEPSHCFGNGGAFGSSLIAGDNKLVCVTSGNSYLGANIVKKLLANGSLVRVTIQNQVDLEDMRCLISDEELNKLESVMVAKMQDLDSLCAVFSGCHAIFHTSSFIDPHGISGYSEQMAYLETEVAKNVIEACSRAAYIRRCIFTSSLLASVWIGDNLNTAIDESCWSSEEFCRENKLWLALGKTRAEQAAWKKSKELKVKLVTLCPGLLMAPLFPHAHKEVSFPYIKGGSHMLRQGILATADVSKVAEAHVHVYEAMDDGACGRYLCFDKIIKRLDEAIQLETELKKHGLQPGSLVLPEDTEEIHSNVSNSKLAKLLFQVCQGKSCRQ